MKFLLWSLCVGFGFGLSFTEPEEIEVINNQSANDIEVLVQKDKRLVLADVLEVGMSKYFYLIDGNLF